jgi:hypothetical protein
MTVRRSRRRLARGEKSGFMGVMIGGWGRAARREGSHVNTVA